MVRQVRMLCLLLMVGVMFALLLTRLSFLMLDVEEEKAAAIFSIRRFFELVPAQRGNIYDRNGVALAVTIPAREIGLDPKLFPRENREADLKNLALILGQDPFEFCRQVSGKLLQNPKSRWIRLAEAVDERRYEEILPLKMPGVYGNRKYLRCYPQRAMAAHIVGFLNRENTACCGVEKFLDFFLRGQDGWLVSEKDGRREEIVQRRLRNVPAIDGGDVFLTIDLTVQRMVEEELKKIEDDFHPTSATIILTAAEDGKILALASIPNYDPNSFWTFPLEHFRNRAVADCYEPGSVFKIVAASAGIEEGIIDLDSQFDCSKSVFEFAGKRYSLPKDYADFGTLSLVDVLRKSSNRGSAQIAIRLGAERFYDYVKSFGFGEKTDYGFDGEIAGILHPPKVWDRLTITRMPMGHAIAVTPMQMHMAMAVLACDGYLLSPQIVERIVSSGAAEGMSVAPKTGIMRRKVLKKGTVRKMRSILSNPADNPDGTFPIAVKTGTSQRIVNGHYVHDRHVASCSGFFPATNPKFVLSVIVDSPDSKGATAWGSRYAKPTFLRLARALQNYRLK